MLIWLIPCVCVCVCVSVCVADISAKFMALRWRTLIRQKKDRKVIDSLLTKVEEVRLLISVHGRWRCCAPVLECDRMLQIDLVWARDMRNWTKQTKAKARTWRRKMR